MKNIFFKIILLLSITVCFSCKAQITSFQYINFYNSVTPKLNSIVPNKTQFYGQNFSEFYSELLHKNLTIKYIGVDSKIANSPQKYILRLYFGSESMVYYGMDKKLQCPVVWITFENEIPREIESMIRNYAGNWNSNFADFFANMPVEKIDFVGVNGVNSPDRTPR